MDDVKRRAWAKEHLMHEVDTLIHATEMLGDEPQGMEANVMLEFGAGTANVRNIEAGS